MANSRHPCQYENHPFQPAPVNRTGDQARDEALADNKQGALQTLYAERHTRLMALQSPSMRNTAAGVRPPNSKRPVNTGKPM